MLNHSLGDALPVLRQANSTAELLQHPKYLQVEQELNRVLDGHVIESYAPTVRESQPTHLRVCSWNIERGLAFAGVLHLLQNHPELKKSDLLIITETDYGMARTQNRDIAGELAKALNMNYAFAPCYLNLDKGSGLENLAAGENLYGLHGNAILSRYPIEAVDTVRLKNGKDKMRGKEKRIGSQQALIAKVATPLGALRLAGFHLDAHSSQRHRFEQLSDVLNKLDALDKQEALPALIGGDWNTSTYNSSNALHAIIGFWIRVFMGVRNVIENYYPHPYRLFERRLFAELERRGFDYRSLNELGACTVHYDVNQLKARKNLADWVPNWCFRFIDWALKPTNGQCGFKLDWFAGRGVHSATAKVEVAKAPQVIHNLSYQGEPVSDHDPIVVDISIGR